MVRYGGLIGTSYRRSRRLNILQSTRVRNIGIIVISLWRRGDIRPVLIGNEVAAQSSNQGAASVIGASNSATI